VLHAEVELQRAVGSLRRDDYRVIGERRERTATARGQGKDRDPLSARRFGGTKKVRGVTACRVDDQQIARPGQRLNLSREDSGEAELALHDLELAGVFFIGDQGAEQECSQRESQAGER
jgi:hypothetical protein